jgi:Domain of unknown function (DUF4062)
MPTDDTHLPKLVQQVMVSSTFTDLEEHRAALILAIQRANLHPMVMEHSNAKPAGDVVDSSLGMVRDSAAYILIISRKYGQQPECPSRNPGKLSITELEFNEAQRLGRPTLLFIMDKGHLTTEDFIEMDPDKKKKLDAFRERAKISSQNSPVHRVYSVFKSLDDFKVKGSASITELAMYLAAQESSTPQTVTPSLSAPAQTPKSLPFKAVPDYIGRHTFIGRKAQLKILSEWAKPSDDHSILLFEAIGGNGKSMLTWEWATKHAETARDGHEPWAGRFWYSFYERGAIMRDFCQHALAYMTGKPLKDFAETPTADLRTELLAELHARPWLLVLDGLERVLVAYHRIDASEVPDEEVNRPTDKVLDRDPRQAIRPGDDELLRALASAAPSKVLVTSRLTPAVLFNPSGLPLPGVQRLVLPGLDDADAEAMLRDCGVSGTSADIRYYLANYCANHPLVIGVLAGLINSPGPHRGNFDAWAADPAYGAKLDLARLDLSSDRRNHILRAALDALEGPSRQLLSTLALLSDAVDYETVAALNPHLPPEPQEVKRPAPMEDSWRWKSANDERKAELHKRHEEALARRKEYEKALESWRSSRELREAPTKLAATIQDLEGRGFLQYDSRTKRYDLHPVIRGVAAGALKSDDKERFGKAVVDHFNAKPHPPFKEAKTMADVESGLHVVRTLLKLGHYQKAFDAYGGDLSEALEYNLEAHAEMLSLLRPFFPNGWDILPENVDGETATYLATDAGNALGRAGETASALEAYGVALRANLEAKNWTNTAVGIRNLSIVQGRLARQHSLRALALELANATGNQQDIFAYRLLLFSSQVELGLTHVAEATWNQLDPMGRNWERWIYRQGNAEYEFARFQFYQGALHPEHLTHAINLAEGDQNRWTLRALHRLSGSWRLERGEWDLAVVAFDRAVTMAREARLTDFESEAGLALAKHHLGELTGDDAVAEAERLSSLVTGEQYVAELWLGLGHADRAKEHALAAYKWAWADGEPYVRRYELDKATDLLQRMNVAIPDLPRYDPAKDEPFPWEAEVRSAIEKIKAEKAAGEAS